MARHPLPPEAFFASGLQPSAWPGPASRYGIQPSAWPGPQPIDHVTSVGLQPMLVLLREASHGARPRSARPAAPARSGRAPAARAARMQHPMRPRTHAYCAVAGFSLEEIAHTSDPDKKLSLGSVRSGIHRRRNNVQTLDSSAGVDGHAPHCEFLFSKVQLPTGALRCRHLPTRDRFGFRPRPSVGLDPALDTRFGGFITFLGPRAF